MAGFDPVLPQASDLRPPTLALALALALAWQLRGVPAR